MSQGPENRFIKSVNDRVPPEIYREKMCNPYRGGTADMWYSARLDLWAEYKWWTSPPKRTARPLGLSKLQELWLRGRTLEGRRCVVICGCGTGGIIVQTPLYWESPITPTFYDEFFMTRAEIAEWIAHVVQSQPSQADNGAR